MANSHAKGQRVYITNPGDITSSVTLAPGDIEIGAVELKNGTDDTRAKIAALSGITSADNGLPVTDPVLGLKLDQLHSDLAGSVPAGTAIIGKVGIDQTTDGTTNLVAAKQSGTWNVTNVSGTVSLPTGAATAALQPSLGTSTSPSANVITTQRPSVTQVVSTALEASHVLKASAGQLVQLSIFNSKASSQFILIMNSTTVPGDGTVTLLYPPIPISAASLLVIDFIAPLVASTGIAVSNSSTGTFTKTIGSADCAFYAQVN